MDDLEKKLHRLIELDIVLKVNPDGSLSVLIERLTKLIEGKSISDKAPDDLYSSYFIGNAEEFIDIKNSIKEHYAESPAISINDRDARDMLRRVNSDELFIADMIVSNLIEDDKLKELASELFYSWFSGEDYVKGLLEIGQLVVESQVPKLLKTFIESARQSYAFQNPIAVYSTCRSILEAAMRDIFEKAGFERNKRKANKYPDQVTWEELKEKFVNEDKAYYSEIKKFLKDYSNFLHAKRNIEKDSKGALRETIDIVQKLYDFYVK